MAGLAALTNQKSMKKSVKNKNQDSSDSEENLKDYYEIDASNGLSYEGLQVYLDKKHPRVKVTHTHKYTKRDKKGNEIEDETTTTSI